MAQTFIELNESHMEFIREQKMFFVASAPSDTENGRVNLSPKGYDTLTILDNKTVFYVDYPGSGNETALHVEENGRLTIMFASFTEEPLVLRLYGKGAVIAPQSPRAMELAAKIKGGMPPHARQLILLDIEAVKTSCGWGVPFYQYAGQRNSLLEWCGKITQSGRIKDYIKSFRR